jgi:predicted TIM-barrel fold metal-dependent hydrolase
MANIDAHCHTIPVGFWEEVRRATGLTGRYAEAAERMMTATRICNDSQMVGGLDERIGILDEADLAMQLISPGMAPSTFFPDPEAGATVSRVSNDELSAACQRYPERYRFWATLPLPHVRQSVDEFRRAAALPGYVGISVPTEFGVPLDDPSLDDLYAELARNKTLLFVHPNWSDNVGRYARLGMESMLLWPADDTLAVMELVLGAVFDRHPGLTVVTPHLSGCVLYLLGRIDRHYDNLPADHRHTREAPSWYIKRMYHDTVTFLRPALDMAREIVGAEHLVLGSDFPWQSRRRLGECVEVVNNLTWPEDELALVRGGNIERLLRERGLWEMREG